MANKLICFPFVDGNLLGFVYVDLNDSDRQRVYNGEEPLAKHTCCGKEIVWKPNEEVELTLHYAGFSRGRHVVVFYWVDDNGHEYPMFLKDVDELLRENMGFSDIHAIFTYVKRGANYGIKFVRRVDSE